MDSKKLNEDCGCGARSYSEPKIAPVSKDLREANIGKIATLLDGRQAFVDDSIRNTKGEVIGYVLTDSKGAFRVFKDKIQNFSESAGAMSTLGNVGGGMGSVTPPAPDGKGGSTIGSGDQFPTIGGGTSKGEISKNSKKARKDNRFSASLMDFKSFMKASQTFQHKDKPGKK